MKKFSSKIGLSDASTLNRLSVWLNAACDVCLIPVASLTAMDRAW